MTPKKKRSNPILSFLVLLLFILIFAVIIILTASTFASTLFFA
jgi:hypothetical protein